MLKRLLKVFLSAFKAKPEERPTLPPTPIVQQDDAERRKISQQWEEQRMRDAQEKHRRKMAAYQSWVDPEAIKQRQEEHEKAAAAALARGLEMSKHAREALGMPLEDPPLPPMDQLPKEMRGQSVSTIRAMLRHANWTYDGSGWHPPKLPGIRVEEGGTFERAWRTERFDAQASTNRNEALGKILGANDTR